MYCVSNMKNTSRITAVSLNARDRHTIDRSMGSSSIGRHGALVSLTIRPVAITMSEAEVPIIIAQRVIINFLCKVHVKVTDILWPYLGQFGNETS